MSTKEKIYTSVLLFVALAVIWLRFTFTPFIWDDIWYHFAISPDFLESRNHFSVNRITSFSDWLTSLQRFGHVFTWRIGNILMLIFTNIGSKHLLNLLHTLVFGVFITSACKLCLGSVTIRNLGVMLLGTILLIPHIDRVLFWSAGSFNYFWGAMCLSLLLSIMQHHNHQNGALKIAAACVLSFLCGGMHEALGVPVLAYLTSLAIIQVVKDKKLSQMTLACIICTAAGLMLPLSSPGLYTRASSPNFASFCSDLVYSICIFTLSCAVPLLVSFLVIIRQRNWNSNKLGSLLMVVFFSLPGLVFASKGFWGGAYFYPSLAMMLFAIPAMAPWLHKQGKTFTFITWCIILAALGISCTQAYSDYQQYADTIRRARQERIIIRNEYTPRNFPSWHLRESLPTGPDKEHNTASIARILELPLFTVGYNIHGKEICAADAFKNDKRDTLRAIRRNQFIIVCLPRHMILCHSTEKSSALVLDEWNSKPLRYPWDYKHRHAFLNLIRGSSHAEYGMDYADDHVYLTIKDKEKAGKAIYLILEHIQTRQIYETTVQIQESP